MFPTKGFNAYKQHWEDQAGFMDKLPWHKDKILKLIISNDFDYNQKNFYFQIIRLRKKMKNLH